MFGSYIAKCTPSSGAGFVVWWSEKVGKRELMAAECAVDQ